MNKKMSPSLVTLLLLFSPPFLLITAGSQRIHETQRLVRRRETKNYDVLLLNTFDSKGLRLTPTWWNKSKTKPFNWAPLAFSSSRTGSSTLSYPQWESTQLTFQGELRENFARLSWLSSSHREMLERVSCSWIILDAPTPDSAVVFLDKACNIFFGTMLISFDNFQLIE